MGCLSASEDQIRRPRMSSGTTLSTDGQWRCWIVRALRGSLLRIIIIITTIITITSTILHAITRPRDGTKQELFISHHSTRHANTRSLMADLSPS